MKFKIELLPPSTEVETKAVLKQLSAAHRYLALTAGVQLFPMKTF